MIVVTIELWPLGYESRKQLLGKMILANQGTGTQTRGDYNVQLMRRGSETQVQKWAEVKDYPRLSYSVWVLIYRALKALQIGGKGKDAEIFNTDSPAVAGTPELEPDANTI